MEYLLAAVQAGPIQSFAQRFYMMGLKDGCCYTAVALIVLFLLTHRDPK